ncbi:carbohydrate ABC transporter permease [Pseudokineococcus lusitanus]|uniref:Carbohydrate ABC transporter membrane protein 2 (CUT1 family) n=1 Tax=Pseudokineococcus lusitanus TaxID=763993 RepID=A0A3N1G8X6_9ACTN|nr:carbohydrate ABC transporter permease [Pseudokineococcus lusitanus]ROP26676.1 carbohydrate ABC transporter membrane protein 2 (CUT1 family) [Pseudokineococcus lusitanus]
MTATSTARGATTAPRGSDAPPARRRRRPLRRHAIYLALVAISVVYLFPFAIQVATAFKTDAQAAAEPLTLVPSPATTAALERLLANSDFPLWAANSALVAVVVTTGRVLFAAMAGYALSRLHWRGRAVVFAGVVAVMAVPQVVLLIPKFLVINQLGIYDSYAGMVVPLLADATSVFIMKNFFDTLPVSVEEAARIDGAGVVRTFWSVVLPMARPALVTVLILSFQGSWNELSHFIVSTQSPELTTLTKGVANLASGALGQSQQFPLRLGAAALMTIPVAVLFFVFQRRITATGEGAEKG